MRNISVLAIILLMLSGCSLLAKEDPVNLIKIVDLEDKLNSKESFILVVANRAQCSPCESYLRGGLRGISDNDGIKAEYVMIDTVDKQKDMDILTKIIYEDLEEDQSQMLGVPTTYIIKEGSLVERMTGAIMYEDLLKAYNEHLKK